MSWRTGISGWATVALAGLGLLALVGVCLRRPIAAPPRRGDAVEAVTSLAMQPPGVLPTTQNASAAGWHCNELQKPPPGGQCVVSILHISDTHGLHRQMAKKFTMPPADLLVHTGDITDMGTDAEMVDFNLWLDDIKHRYKYGVYLVSGNHDWMWALNRVAEKKVPPEAVIHPKYLQNKVTSAKVLHHEMVEVAGLRIFGSDWCPWFGYAAPGDYWKMEWSDDRGLIYDRWKQQVLRSGKMAPVPTHRYDEIPEGVDILLSHMAPWNIFDHTLEGNWGSSQALLGRIQQTKPKAHLFGHIHEMRGGWERCNQSEAYRGGAEYEPLPGKIFAPQPAPPKEYPTDLILNNAQLNSLWVDHAYTGEWQPNSIAGPGKLIVARWSGGRWRFTAQARSDEALLNEDQAVEICHSLLQRQPTRSIGSLSSTTTTAMRSFRWRQTGDLLDDFQYGLREFRTQCSPSRLIGMEIM